jgi:hypothetical protein
MTTATIHPMREVSDRSCLLLAGATHLSSMAPAAVPNLAAVIFAGPGGSLERTA